MAFERLSEEDLEILELESPTIAGHTCKVVIVEDASSGKSPTLDDVREYIAARLSRAPRLRQKIARIPLGLGPPLWVDDASFDIRNHIRRVDVSGPVGHEEFQRIVAESMATRLDRARPLWAMDMVDSLQDGGFALIWRIHHCMADGITAFRLAGQVLWDTQPDPEPSKPARWQPEPEPTRLELLGLGMRGTLERVSQTLRRTRSRSERQVVGSLPDRSGAARVADFISTFRRELTPKAHSSPLDFHPTTRRTTAVVSVPLADLKRIEKALAAGATINDVILAGVTGGLRCWLDHRGAGMTGLRVKVPTSLHHQDIGADVMGNRDSFMFVDLPVAEPDPVERLRAINRETRERKAHHDPETLDAFFRDLRRTSKTIEHLLERWSMSPHVFTLNVSNVPGPREPLFVMQRPVRGFFSLAEIADRHALRIAVVSVSGRVSFGLCADAAACSDLDVLAAGIQTEIAILGSLS